MRALRLALRDPLALAALLLLLLLAALAVAPTGFTDRSPNRTSRERLLPPGGAHPMGTDQFGRDVAARAAHAAGASLGVGLGTVALALALGVPLGAAAGWRVGAAADTVIMRCMDVLMAFPPIVLAIAVVAALGTTDLALGPLVVPHAAKLVLVLGVLNAPKVARITRAAVMLEVREPYVLAERAVGAAAARILFRDVLRNAAPPVTVFATLLVGGTILAEASLSFLGLGIQPPQPSWGGMLADSRTYVMGGQWWLTVFPGAMIFATVCAFNLAGDLLRDLLDPLRLTAAAGA